jgi:5-methylthioadenosine/S-adenosylhomocysteine deaminase
LKAVSAKKEPVQKNNRPGQHSIEDNAAAVLDGEFILGNAQLVCGAFLPIIENGALHIHSGRIRDIGPTDSITFKNPHIQFFDARGAAIIPGMFNAHTHLPMGFFRGLGRGKIDMIESFLFPAEKNLSEELVAPLSYSYLLDGLRAGVTSFVDHYYFSSGVAKALETFGARGWVGETIADLGGAFPGESSWDRAIKLIEKSRYSSRIRFCIAPHAADTVSSSMLRRCADFARANKLPLHMHLAQSEGERKRVESRDGLTPVAAAQKAGALGENSLVVHLTSASEQDLQIIKNSGSTIGYCPTSTILYDRLAKIKTISDLEIPMALATDCAASNDSADCLTELKFAALIGKHEGISDSKLSPDHLLAMVTTIPAKVLGVGQDLGTLEKGKIADLTILPLRLSALPRENLLANIIYSMGSRDITHVMIDGKWIIWKGQLASNSERTLHDDYLTAVSEITKRISPMAAPSRGGH